MTGSIAYYQDLAPGSHQFDTYEEVENFIKVFEAINGVKFTVLTTTKAFGSFDTKNVDVKRLIWPTNNVPTIRAGSRIYQCRHKQGGIEPSKPCKNQKEMDEHGYGVKIKDEPGEPVPGKVDYRCPARLYVKEGVKFPDYKINVITKEAKRHKSEKLKDDLNNGVPVQAVKFFDCDIPTKDNHVGHSLGNVSFIQQSIDTYLSSEIHRLAREGIKDDAEIRRHLTSSLEAMAVIPLEETSRKITWNEEPIYERVQTAKRLKTEEIDKICLVYV